jgi:hypothetical protein
VLSFYKGNKYPGHFTNMKLSMFRSPGDTYPKLKGKAAEVRKLGPALLHVFEKHMQSPKMQHKQIRLALRCSCRMEEIVDDHPLEVVWPNAVAEEYLANCYNFLALATCLANMSMQTGEKLFNITIKFHYLLHVALQARYLNPRLSWTYSGEDFMQKMKGLAAACTKGLGPYEVFNKVVSKYCLGMDLLLRRQR